MKSIFLNILALLCFANTLFGQGSTDVNDQPRVRKGQEKGKKGAYTEWNMANRHPYTMFDNLNEIEDNNKFAELITDLRDQVATPGSHLLEVYTPIYNDANDYLATNEDHKETGVNLRS